MKLSAKASSLYVQAIPKDCRIIGRFSYCFQHGEGIVNPTCCLCHAALNLIPLFITVILLFIIYCSNSRYFAYNSSKYRLHLYLLMFCRSVPMQYIKNDEYQSRWTRVPFANSYILWESGFLMYLLQVWSYWLVRYVLAFLFLLIFLLFFVVFSFFLYLICRIFLKI